MTEHAHPREIIAVENLVQTIGGQEILRGFSLKVYEGETLVLLGRSGGGRVHGVLPSRAVAPYRRRRAGGGHRGGAGIEVGDAACDCDE